MPSSYYMGKKVSSSSLTESSISNIIEDNPSTAASSHVVYDLSNKKMEYYIITFDGTSFKYNDQVLTFNEIKEKCLDNKNFVYALYSNRLYIPQYISNNNIFFESSYPDSDVPQMHRIGINNLNLVNKYSYNLVKDTQLNSAVNDLNQHLVNIPISPSASNKIHEFTTNETWSATEDCWIIGFLTYSSTQGNNNTNVMINGISMFVAYAKNTDSFANVSTFIKKNTVVKTGTSGGYSSLSAYSINR